ncbi:MAG TPA: hypothetical protein VEU62_11915 [Bryobacterales bacterium]|nr:hypothetical protein [Bryobacterales bacterium]
MILSAFLLYLASLHMAGNFGRYHDDTLYFSSAQALAQGRRYIMPSVPGNPPQGKYPILYSWLLSWIWKWQPSFPANVSAAVWMTAGFACWFLIAAFQMLRRLAGFGNGTALALTALCAFQPHFVFLSGSVLSDMPFMALALTAALVADGAFRPTSPPGLALVAGILAGLSVMTRGAGLAVVAAIAAAALCRRAYRRAAVFCLAAAPFLLSGFLLRAAPDPALQKWAAMGGPGFRQTWAFYTGYWGFWRLSVPDWPALRLLLAANIHELLETPASLCLFPPLGDGSYVGVLLGYTLSTGILAGLARQARRQEWKPVHFLFPFYAALVVMQVQAQMDRYLLLFLPLFYGGLWIEGRHFVSLLLSTVRASRPAGEKALAGVLSLSVLVLGGLAADHYVRGFRPQLREQSAERATLSSEQQQLYDWIRHNTDPQSRFVAYEDVNLYLHTGRQAMRPIEFSGAAFLSGNDAALESGLAHITDVAEHIGASYWVVTPQDFIVLTNRAPLEKRLAQVRSAFPVVFRSRDHQLQVLDLSCLQHPGRSECHVAALNP